MDVRKVVLLVGALMIAAVTAMMARTMFAGASAPPVAAKAAVVSGPEVLVATRPLAVGTIIDTGAFRYQAWPQGLIQDAYFVRGEAGGKPQELIGTVVRNEISAGQPLSQGALVRPGDRGFLAAALSPGMRAVTVGVNNISSVAGFVFPGDRVDVVLTQEVAGGGDGPPLKVSETILRNLRVLATNRRMSGTDPKGKPVIVDIDMVTLEATPRIAEKIAVAETIGRLSLSLRSLADTTSDLERAIASGEIDVPDGADPAAERRMLASIATRPTDSGSTATVGADVSRFQRGTIPARPAAPPPPEGAAAPAGTAPRRAATPTVRVARGNDVTEVAVGGK